MTNRTDELRKSGAKDRTGEQYPFVAWPGSKHDPPGQYTYAYIEGRVERLWTGKYGLVAVLTVTDVSSGLLGVIGSGDDRQEAEIAVGETVNVGLKLAALAGTISEKDIGTEFHIAFAGWAESQAGDPFRQFTVLEVPSKDGHGEPDAAPMDGDEFPPEPTGDEFPEDGYKTGYPMPSGIYAGKDMADVPVDYLQRSYRPNLMQPLREHMEQEFERRGVKIPSK